MQLISLVPEQRIEHQKWISHFKNRYGFIFFDASYEQVPFASQFFNDKSISSRVSRLEQYLLGTYPIDMGTNVHQELNKLRYSFSKKEYKWHQRQNKLGINCWGTQAGIGLLALNVKLKRDDLRIAESFFPKDYHSMSFEQKMRFCSSIDKKLHTILEKIYSDYS